MIIPAGSYTPLIFENEALNVTNTSIVVTKKNDDGVKFINQYMIIKELGRLVFGNCIEEVMELSNFVLILYATNSLQ